MSWHRPSYPVNASIYVDPYDQLPIFRLEPRNWLRRWRFRDRCRRWTNSQFLARPSSYRTQGTVAQGTLAEKKMYNLTGANRASAFTPDISWFGLGPPKYSPPGSSSVRGIKLARAKGPNQVQNGELRVFGRRRRRRRAAQSAQEEEAARARRHRRVHFMHHRRERR